MILLCLLIYSCSAQGASASSSSNNPNKHLYLIEIDDHAHLATIFGKKVLTTLGIDTLNIITDYVINRDDINEQLQEKSHLTQNGRLEQWQPAQKFSGKYFQILGVAFSPDGSQIASGSGGNSIEIWNTKTGQKTQTLTALRTFSYDEDPPKCVNTIAFSPNGSQIAAGANDASVKIWNTKTGQNRFTRLLELNRSLSVQSIAFSPDSSWIAAGSDDGTIRIFHTREQKLPHTYQIGGYRIGDHSGSVNSIACSPDGSLIASGSSDKTIGIWNTTTGQNTGILLGHSSRVNAVAFSPNGLQIASGSDDETIRIWNIKNRKTTHIFLDHKDSVLSVAFSPDSSQIISGSRDETIRIWDIKSGQNIHTLAGHSNCAKTMLCRSGRIKSVAFSPNGSQIASGSCDGTNRLWGLSHAKIPVSTMLLFASLATKQAELAVQEKNRQKLTQSATTALAINLSRKKSWCSIQ